MEGHFEDCICKLCRIRRRKNGKKCVPCKFFLEDRCRHVATDGCKFAHLSFEMIPPCPFVINCNFGPTECLFLHEPLRELPVLDNSVPPPWIPPAPPVPKIARKKKKKKRSKKKKNNKKNRLVESNPDSQSSQNQFQPLSKVLEDAADSDFGSESDDSSTQEEEATLFSDDPSGLEELSEVKEKEAPNSSGDIDEAQVQEVKDESVQAPIPTTPLQNNSPNETEESPAPQPHVLRTKYDNYRCTTCKYTLYKYRPYMGTDPSSIHYFIPNSSCTRCGVELVEGYSSHDPIWKSNDCRFIDEKFCDICLLVLSPQQQK